MTETAPAALGTLRSALVTTTEVAVSGDTFIRQGIPNLNEGNDARLSVQTNSRHRSLVYFNPLDIQSAVGAGTLVSAHIELTLSATDNNWGPGRPIGIHRMTHASSENRATWSCAIDSNITNLQADCSGENVWSMAATNPALLPYAFTPTGTAVITNGQTGVVSLDVSADVEAIVSGGAPAHGWLIKKVDESTSAPGALTFASRELGPAPRMILAVEPPPVCNPTGSIDECNGLDDDCDGNVDEDFIAASTTCGVGACEAAGETNCIGGEVINDCSAESPASDDAVCDGVDSDCDGVVDEDYAVLPTSCGVGACGSTGATSCVLGEEVDSCVAGEPAAGDAACDGVDSDCDGAVDEEYVAVATSCGVGACGSTGTTSCASGAVVDSCTPGQAAADDAACDGVDSDCDGAVDEDYAALATSCGVGACGSTGTTSCVLGAEVDSCTPGEAAADDAACDGVDADCDGAVDEEYAAVATTCGIGACAASGSTSCVGGSVVDGCTPLAAAADDAVCDGVDNDCDAVVDEDYATLVTSCGVGACGSTGSTSCVLGAVVDSCTPGEAAATDASCDGVDDDCDGTEDEEYLVLATSCGVGACAAAGATACAEGVVVDNCTPGAAAADDATCDGVDADCDGATDEDFVPGCAGTSALTCVNGSVQSDDCSDGDACNGQETCAGLASCQPGTPPDPDDADPCTLDGCEPAIGVTHVLLPEGTACGTYDECDGSGQCVSWLPPDPADVAPVLAGASVSMLDRVRFMFEGASPIQAGVVPGVIEQRTVAVVQGRTLDADGNPLPNVTVSVLGHPELGHTLSRIDGAYDLVVNGGGSLTLQFAQYGSQVVQRTLDVPWQNYISVNDVALRASDSAVSSLTFPAAVAQVHRASSIADARGTRSATLYVPAGSEAELVLPDGSTSPAATLGIRATEFSAGSLGEQALPLGLPATAAYAYALEISADEAVAAGAERVELSQPASLYVENFLGLPVGASVSLAALDRTSASWVGLEDGTVLEILAEVAGVAELDVDGSGSPAAASELAALGITTAERETIAQLYDPSARLWRARISHFAAFDVSLPHAVDEGVGGQIPAAPSLAAHAGTDVLSQTLPIAGTPFTLNYRSDRVLGSKAARTLIIPVTAGTVSSTLLDTLVEIEVAGQLEVSSFGIAPNHAAAFTWNGTDINGRNLHGWQRANVRVGWELPASYRQPAAFESSHAHVSAATPFGNAGSAVRYRRYEKSLRAFDARRTGIGAWSLNRHHSYDPIGRVMYRGDGSSRSTDTSALIIDRFAGVAQTSSVGTHNGDGGHALLARMDSPRSLAVGPDGAVYIGTRRGVRRVDPNTQIMTTVAGGKDALNCNSTMQDGPALDACIFARRIEFGSDGALYIADNPTATGSTDRIRRLDLGTGMISHVAGAPDTTGCADNGDGGPARDAVLCSLLSMAIAPDGSIYVLDRGPSGGPQGVRKISPNGIIETVAAGDWSAGDDSGDIDVGPDGSVYVTQPRSVSRILPTGEVRRFAGDPAAPGSSGDGGPATSARFGNGGPAGVMVAPDGRVYIADNGNAQLRVVDQSGIIERVAGTTPQPASGNGGSPLLATLGAGVLRTALAPDGTIYLTSRTNHTVRFIQPNRSGNFATAVAIPSIEDGETYEFDANGRHLRTTSSSTGAVLIAFGYDAAGRLTSVTDGSGNTTTITRDASGAPTAIVSPLGEETLLDTDANGYLSGIFPPAAQQTELESDGEGLLVRMVDGAGLEQFFEYDDLGRLMSE